MIAYFGSADRHRVEERLELLWPFANALIWELLTITFLSLGLGHFNYVTVDEKGLRKLVESININLPAHQLSKEKSDSAFKMWWPIFRDEHLRKIRAVRRRDPP